ncbi:MAG: glycosyltransferase, partial [Prevotellaceae bacterium]|nr:glycosyltransferase [Prevotellaceae bacterium]
RNVGLEHAKGKWLLFADADDFFHIDKFQILDQFQQSSSDIIYMRVDSVYSDTLEKAKRGRYIDLWINSYLKTNDDSELRYRCYVTWGKMIKKSLVDKYNLRFDETYVANDMMFSIKTGFCANEVSVINEIIYCVTMRYDSLTYGSTGYSASLCRYKVALNVNAFLRKINKKQYQCSLIRQALRLFKYGIKSFIEVMQLAKAANMNILTGFSLSRFIRSRLFSLYPSLFKFKHK